jgi:hypothetical protein
MSFDVTHIAYKTKLGNLPAKSILVLLADMSDPKGYSFPGVDYIADRTEINARTVHRVFQVFVAIELLEKVPLGKHKSPGLQLNLAMLGQDLRERFAQAYAAAQKQKRAAVECLTDTSSDAGDDVSQTPENVSQTLFDVSQTPPLEPLKGVTVIQPSENRNPVVPCTQGTKNESEKSDAGTKENGAADLASNCVSSDDDRAPGDRRDRLQPAGDDQLDMLHDRPGDATGNAQGARGAGDRRDRPGAGESGAAADRALEQIASALGITRPRTLRAIRSAIACEAEKGDPLPTIALAMIAASKKQDANSRLLTCKFGPDKFFGLGIWRDESRWYWNEQLLREQAGASVGSFQPC